MILRLCKWLSFPSCLLAAFVLLPICAWSQVVICGANATVAAVHSEGLAETVGDVVLTCSGGNAGSNALLTPFVALNTNITNRLDANGVPTNISVTVNTGLGPVASGSIGLSGPATVIVSGVSYTIPTPSTGAVTITIKGIRAAVGLLNNGLGISTVYATVAGVGFQTQGVIAVPVAVSSPTLLASTLNNAVSFCGLALPSPVDFAGMIASGSVASAVRVTEASVGAFLPKAAADDSGTRILVRFSGYASGVRLFAPDAIVGNTGSQPTSAGAFGTTVAGGTYNPGSSQLLLVRVAGADAAGAAGTLAIGLPAGLSTFGSMTEVALSSGAGYVVYEVVDGNPAVVESAQIPVFPVLPQNNCSPSPSATLGAVLAPVSNVAIATAVDPMPRFIALTTGPDCQVFGDCAGGYIPVLSVNQTSITLAGASLGGPHTTSLGVSNAGGAQMAFQVTTAYQSGSGWLSVSPSSGINTASLTVTVNPGSLQPGTYNATITINAGGVGQAIVPVIFNVGPQGVTIQGVVNAASFQIGPISSGSYVALFGLNLAGTNVGVTFNGLAGTVKYDSAGQINLIVPNLGVQAGASVIATIDGKVSDPFTVSLTANVPGIFTPGIVNPNGTVNSAANPAKRGDNIALYLTGLADPVTGPVTVNMGSTTAGTGLNPLYAGLQGTLPGLDQVNVTIPVSLIFTGNSVPIGVCVIDFTGKVCSNQVSLFVQ